MAIRRILYGLVLLAVLLFQITNNNYLAHFLLALCIVLPLLSLLLSLPGMLGCRLRLAAAPALASRNDKAEWSVSIDEPIGLPLARVKVRLTARNRFTGQEKRLKLKLNGVAHRLPVPMDIDTGHCGLLELQADKLKVYDYLGLFSTRPKLPPPARLLCRPIPVDPGPVNIPDVQGRRTIRPGAVRRGPGEDYDLRDYRPGDPMRSVHWKLSSKWDDLIVREPAEALVPLPLLTFDRFGTPEELDRVLDRLFGLNWALLAVQRPHAVLWLDGEEPQLHTVSDERELRECLLAILSTPAPRSGVPIDSHPELIAGGDGPVFRVHVTGAKEADHD